MKGMHRLFYAMASMGLADMRNERPVIKRAAKAAPKEKTFHDRMALGMVARKRIRKQQKRLINKQDQEMNKKIKKVLLLAVEVIANREGDLDTEDGTFATTDLDSIIELEAAICDAFDTASDDVIKAEITAKIAAL